MSTGSSFAHVPADGVRKTLKEMDQLVKPGGYLYFDSRNWEKELRNKKRFQYGRPFIRPDGTRINYVQVWDYHSDHRITINILNAYERDGQIIHQAVYEEQLNPFPVQLVLSVLEDLHYEAVTIKPLPYRADTAFEEMDWYCLLARKPEKF